MTCSRRIIATVTSLAFLSACTSSIPVPKSEAIEQKEFYRHKMRLHLTNGEELNTKRMTVADSTVTVFSLLEGGKTVEQSPPIVIPLSEVQTMERVQFDDAKTLGFLAFAALPLLLLWGIHTMKWGGST